MGKDIIRLFHEYCIVRLIVLAEVDAGLSIWMFVHLAHIVKKYIFLWPIII